MSENYIIQFKKAGTRNELTTRVPDCRFETIPKFSACLICGKSWTNLKMDKMPQAKKDKTQFIFGGIYKLFLITLNHDEGGLLANLAMGRCVLD